MIRLAFARVRSIVAHLSTIAERRPAGRPADFISFRYLASLLLPRRCRRSLIAAGRKIPEEIRSRKFADLREAEAVRSGRGGGDPSSRGGSR